MLAWCTVFVVSSEDNDGCLEWENGVCWPYTEGTIDMNGARRLVIETPCTAYIELTRYPDYAFVTLTGTKFVSAFWANNHALLNHTCDFLRVSGLVRTMSHGDSSHAVLETGVLTDETVFDEFNGLLRAELYRDNIMSLQGASYRVESVMSSSLIVSYDSALEAKIANKARVIPLSGRRSFALLATNVDDIPEVTVGLLDKASFSVVDIAAANKVDVVIETAQIDELRLHNVRNLNIKNDDGRCRCGSLILTDSPAYGYGKFINMGQLYNDTMCLLVVNYTRYDPNELIDMCLDRLSYVQTLVMQNVRFKTDGTLAEAGHVYLEHVTLDGGGPFIGRCRAIVARESPLVVAGYARQVSVYKGSVPSYANGFNDEAGSYMNVMNVFPKDGSVYPIVFIHKEPFPEVIFEGTNQSWNYPGGTAPEHRTHEDNVKSAFMTSTVSNLRDTGFAWVLSYGPYGENSDVLLNPEAVVSMRPEYDAYGLRVVFSWAITKVDVPLTLEEYTIRHAIVPLSISRAHSTRLVCDVLELDLPLS